MAKKRTATTQGEHDPKKLDRLVRQLSNLIASARKLSNRAANVDEDSPNESDSCRRCKELVSQIERINDPRVINALQNVITQSSSRVVQEYVVNLLGGRMDRTSVPFLCSFLDSRSDNHDNAGAAAARVLGNLDDSRSTDTLFRNARRRSGLIEVASLEALRKSTDPRKIDLALQGNDFIDWVVKIAGEKAVPILAEFLALARSSEWDPDEPSYVAANDGFGVIRSRSADNPHPKKKAMIALIDLGVEREVVDTLAKLNFEKSLKEALIDLAKRRHSTSFPILVKSLLKNLDCVPALGLLGDERAILPLLERLWRVCFLSDPAINKSGQVWQLHRALLRLGVEDAHLQLLRDCRFATDPIESLKRLEASGDIHAAAFIAGYIYCQFVGLYSWGRRFERPTENMENSIMEAFNAFLVLADERSVALNASLGFLNAVASEGLDCPRYPDEWRPLAARLQLYAKRQIADVMNKTHKTAEPTGFTDGWQSVEPLIDFTRCTCS